MALSPNCPATSDICPSRVYLIQALETKSVEQLDREADRNTSYTGKILRRLAGVKKGDEAFWLSHAIEDIEAAAEIDNEHLCLQGICGTMAGIAQQEILDNIDFDGNV